MTDFHPAALAAMLKTLRLVPADHLPVWGEYFDGPDGRHSVRVTRHTDGLFTVGVLLPPDFSLFPQPKWQDAPMDASASARQTLAANGEEPVAVELPRAA